MSAPLAKHRNGEGETTNSTIKLLEDHIIPDNIGDTKTIIRGAAIKDIDSPNPELVPLTAHQRLVFTDPVAFRFVSLKLCKLIADDSVGKISRRGSFYHCS